MAEIVPPSPPSHILRVSVLDDDIFEFPYGNDMDAKNAIEMINEYGLWIEARYYPVHRIEYMEILSPADQKTEDINRNRDGRS